MLSRVHAFIPVIKQRLADSDEEMSMQLEYILRLVQNTDVGADGTADTDDENAMSDDDGTGVPFCHVIYLSSTTCVGHSLSVPSMLKVCISST